MKKSLLVSFVLTLVLFGLPISSQASENGHDHDGHSHDVNANLQTVETLTESNNELNGEIGILYVPCPEGGKHTMTSHAAGELYKDGKIIIKDGFAWQCSKCLDVIVSQYNPKWVKKLGKYGRMNPGFRLKTFYIMKYPTTVGTASSTTVEPWISSYVWY